MTMIEALLPEYDHEISTTRRVLERAPLAEGQWKPHQKSMSMHDLASHMVEIPSWGLSVANHSFHDLAAGGRPERKPFTSTEQLLEAFDKMAADARQAMTGLSDADLMSKWSLKNGETELMSMPKIAVIRGFVMNHLIHHRGQMSVYLRLKDIPVPYIYGPSADENSM